MKKLAVMALLALVHSAHAGFLTGFVVGTAMSGSASSSPNPNTSQLLASDSHDVIVCQQGLPGKCATYAAPVRNADQNGKGGVFDNPGGCKFTVGYEITNLLARLTCTPAQYAINAGYKSVARIATFIENGTVYLVLEVTP